MGVMDVGSFLLADAISSLQSFISVFTGVYVLLIFAYILTSWIKLPYSPTLNRIRSARTASAPKSPNTAPDAPTETWMAGSTA